MEGLTEAKGWKSVSPSLELGKAGFSRRYEIKVCFQHPFSQSCWQIRTTGLQLNENFLKILDGMAEEGGQ